MVVGVLIFVNEIVYIGFLAGQLQTQLSFSRFAIIYGLLLLPIGLFMVIYSREIIILLKSTQRKDEQLEKKQFRVLLS